MTDELAADKLAHLPFPGVFEVFYKTDRQAKNTLEKKMEGDDPEKIGEATDHEILQKAFNRMK